MNVVTRAEWGARSPKATHLIPAPEGVGVHWEGPSMGAFSHDACPSKVRSIQRFHMDSRGWDDLAYSWLVCPHGYIFEGRGWGVRTAANGTNYGNDHFYAACYLGGEGDPFTAEARQAFEELFVAAAARGYGLVRPHSFFKPTACPGGVIRSWLANRGTPTIPAGRNPRMILVRSTDSPAVYLFFGRADFVGIEDPTDFEAVKRAGVPYVEVSRDTFNRWAA